jgi:lysophospholipase
VEKADSLKDTGIKDLLDWYKANMEESSFTGTGGGTIRYAIQGSKSSRGTLVIISGRAEFLEKYIEMCRDLQDCGYRICLFDHDGQGGSGRQLKDSQKGHIDDFRHYVDDLHFLLTTVEVMENSSPTVILAHSMGGTIATLFSAQYPLLVDGLVLVSPMLQINTGVFRPPLLTEVIAIISCCLGNKEKYVFGGARFNSNLPFLNNQLTSDPDRFKRNLQFIQHNEKLALGSPTFGWLRQAYRGMRQARDRGPKLRCPILLFQGAEDRVVGLKEMDSFCDGAENCELIRYPKGRHELLMEGDFIRDPLLLSIKDFLGRLE